MNGIGANIKYHRDTEIKLKKMEQKINVKNSVNVIETLRPIQVYCDPKRVHTLPLNEMKINCVVYD